MDRDIVAVRIVGAHRMHLRFADGRQGEVDLTQIVPFEGVFAPLQDPARFAEVRVNGESGTVEWPNGADLDPDVLYSKATGTPLPKDVKDSA